MAREQLHQNPRRACALIENDLYKAAQTKARQLDMPGGFSEYVERLLIADMKNKTSAALRVGRFHATRGNKAA